MCGTIFLAINKLIIIIGKPVISVCGEMASSDMCYLSKSYSTSKFNDLQFLY